MSKFKVGNVVKHTFPPYIDNVQITRIYHYYDPPRYLLDNKLMVTECGIQLMSDDENQPNSVCRDCHGTGSIVLLTSVVACNCTSKKE